MKSDRKRLIELSLPLKAISEQSAREKSIRHGHISTLYIWWVCRPLAAMRAAIFASLARQSTVSGRRSLPRRRRNTTIRGVNLCPSPTPAAKA